MKKIHITFIVSMLVLVSIIGLFFLFNVEKRSADYLETIEAESVDPSFGFSLGNTTTKNGHWLKLIKHSAIERFLFYNLTHERNGVELNIEMNVNTTVFNFLRETYTNWGGYSNQERLRRCRIIEPYIQEDFPNFSCDNPTHRQILLDRLQSYIENGWELFRNGASRGFINVTGNHVTILIPNITHFDRIRFGQFTLIQEYQEINLINYKLDWGEVNATLFLNDSDGWNSTADDVWVEHRNLTDKFGANVFRTEDTYLRYLIESDRPIFKARENNVYYISRKEPRQCGSIRCVNEERHLFDFSDICNVDSFNPQCEFNLSLHKLEITFYGEYNSTLGYVSVDPGIVVENAGSFPSILNNVTQETDTSITGISHLTIGDLNTGFINDTNLVLYLPFDVNLTFSGTPTAPPSFRTIGYDYSKKNNDGTARLDNTTWSESGIIGGAIDFSGDGSGINIPDAFKQNETDGFTATAWVKTLTSSAGRDVINHGRSSFVFNTFGNNDLTCALRNSSGFGEGAAGFDNFQPALGVWYNVGCTWDWSDTTLRVYVNGVLNSSFLYVGFDEFQFTGISSIGYNRNDAVNYWNGSIDEVMMINRTLTATEMLSIYNNKSSRFFPTGQQQFQLVNISQSGSEDRVNITINNLSFTGFNSSLSVRIGEVNISDYNDSLSEGKQAISAQGLVLNYHFDNRTNIENATNIFDFAGGINNGTPINQTQINSNGFYFGGLRLDGDGDYLRIPYNVTLNLLANSSSQNLTLMMWINVTSLTGGRTLFSQEDGDGTGRTWIRVKADGDIATALGGGAQDLSSDTPVTVNNWHHVAITYQGKQNITVGFVDGEQKLNNTKIGFDEGANGTFRLGNSKTGEQDFNGTIDEVLLFNRTLTATEINRIFVAGKFNHRFSSYLPINETNLTVTFPIDTTTNYVLTDFLFRAGNESSNSFISPALAENITVESFEVAPVAPIVTSFNCTSNDSIETFRDFEGEIVRFFGPGNITINANLTNWDRIDITTCKVINMQRIYSFPIALLNWFKWW